MYKTSLHHILIFFLCCTGFQVLAAKKGEMKPGWNSGLKTQKVFIENKGQFADIQGRKILFANFDSNEEFYLTDKGLIIKIDTVKFKKPFAKKMLDLFENEKESEREYFKETSYYLFAEWQNTNTGIKVGASGLAEGYYTFGMNTETCNGYRKITYQDIYPGIDIVYSIPNDSTGVKYNLVLHPGGDISNASLLYNGDVTDISADNFGNVIIKTPLQDIVEHAPASYYSGTREEVASSFVLKDKLVTFYVADTIQDKTIIFDPWVSGVTGFSDPWGYDVEFDWTGNLYVYFNDFNGSTNNGLYVRKFSPSGAMMWTHTVTTAFTYEGNFMLDKLANKIYVSEGFNSSGAQAYRLDLTGVADGFISQANSGFLEMWDMAFDCNLNRIVGVGGGTSTNLTGGLINPVTGAVSIANFTGLSPTDQDIACQAVDGQGNLFVVYAYAAGYMDHLISQVNATLNGNVWQVPHGMYGFQECMNHPPMFTCSGPGSNAFNGLDVNNDYLFYYDGGGLAVFNKASGAQIAATSVGFSGTLYTPRYQGGIAVDDCNNIYVGGPNSNLLAYTFNGTTFSAPQNIPLNWPGNQSVFDVKYDRNMNTLFVSGHGNVAVISAPFSGTCINNSISDTVVCSTPQTGNGTVTVSTNLSNPLITYTWYDSGGTVINTTTNSSSLTNSVTGLALGTYIVRAQINPTCGPMLIDTVEVTCPTCGSNVATTPVSCYGGNDGTATATPFGGNGPYSFAWSPAPGSGQGTANAGGLSAIAYTVLITDGNNCPSSTTVTITQPAVLTPSVPANTSVSCFGDSDGTATASATGGTPPYTYLWNDPAPAQTTITATGLAAGTWTVLVTDSNNCSASASVNISQPPVVTATIPSQTNVSCFGGSDGTATVSANGGTGGTYTYLWDDPAPSQATITATGLSAGYWTVQVTDSNGCVTTASVTITQPAQLVASVPSFTNVSCFNGNDGTATAQATGGTGTYTYLWDDPAPAQTTITATGLSTGTWTVQVTDINSCISTASVTITQPAQLTASIQVFTNVSCFGGSDGTATASATGGTGAYTYLWNDPAPAQTTITAIGLPVGTWTVQVTDINSCTSSASVTITQPAVLTASIQSQTNVSCNGASTGSATVVATGGTGTYSYIWNDPVPSQTTITATGLAAGTYTVQVTDQNLCTSTASVTITQPALLVASILSQTNVSCNGGPTGSATVTATGGTGSYTYLWNDPAAQTTQTATGLSAGIWTVQVMDINNCISTAMVTITEPAVLTAIITAHNNVSCFGGSDGSLTASVTGGTTAYTYSWSNSQNTATASGLNIGTYTVTVTDAMGCFDTTKAVITQQSPLVLTIIPVNVSCFGTNTGSADLTVSGGAFPYVSYLWSNSYTTEDVLNIAAGTYSVIVTDNNNCTGTASVTITEPPLLTADVTSLTNITCSGGNDGTASVAVTGGTMPYTYNWAGNPSVNFSSVTNLSAGNSSVSVTDSKGCLATDVFSLTEPPELTVMTSPDVTICNGWSSTLTANATGGTSPYFYYWENQQGASSYPVSPVTNTTYHVYVVDANGCTSATSVVKVYVIPPVNINIYPVMDSICPGDSTGIIISINNGTGGPYTISLIDGTIIPTPYTVHPLVTQQYIIKGSDACGSEDTDTTSIFVYPAPPVDITADKYSGCSPLKVQFYETSPDNGQSYLWDFDSPDENNLSFSKNPVHIFDVPGSYDITQTVTSAEGCKTTLTIPDMITVYPLPEADFSYEPVLPTILNPVVNFTNRSTGNVGNQWSFGDGDSSLVIHPTHYYEEIGEYPVILTAISDKGCRDTVEKIVKISDVFTFYAPTAFSPDKDGKNDIFYVYASGIDETTFQLYLYDRWGELIFKTNDLHKGWDGKVKGVTSQIGTYTWTAFFKDFLGNQKNRTGKVTLIR